MKTTSYEISKQLAESGFKAETDFYWHNYDNGADLRHIADSDGAGKYKSYDLETILEALPKQHDFFSRGVGKYELLIWYHEKKMFIGYQNFDGFDKLLTLEQEKNESLADTAARLLILLYNKGLINFNEVK